MEKGVQQVPQAKMVQMVLQALLVHLVPLAPLVSVGTLLLSMTRKAFHLALDQWG